MGRPSLLEGGADYTGSGGEVSEVRIGGQCVAMMSGTIVSRYPKPQMGFRPLFAQKPNVLVNPQSKCLPRQARDKYRKCSKRRTFSRSPGELFAAKL